MQKWLDAEFNIIRKVLFIWLKNIDKGLIRIKSYYAKRVIDIRQDEYLYIYICQYMMWLKLFSLTVKNMNKNVTYWKRKQGWTNRVLVFTLYVWKKSIDFTSMKKLCLYCSIGEVSLLTLKITYHDQPTIYISFCVLNWIFKYFVTLQFALCKIWFREKNPF